MSRAIICALVCTGSVLLAAHSLQNIDAESVRRGKETFQKRCTGCHALATDREGPRLQGVFGRTSGTVSGFAYSTALKDAHIVWDEKSLEKWLTDPDVLVPGNNMGFSVPNSQERQDLIQFLRANGPTAGSGQLN